MTRVRSRSRAPTHQLAFIDAYPFPSGIRLRFAGQHAPLSGTDVRTVEAATRQWFRLAARHPRAKLSMPSIVVDAMWRELILRSRGYAEFCETAFLGFLPHTPPFDMNAEPATADRAGLATTYRLARHDEPGRLPLLFRVNQELGIRGGRYLADCGGRGHCHPMAGMLCLQHIDGPGGLRRGPWDRGRSLPGGAAVYTAGQRGGVRLEGVQMIRIFRPRDRATVDDAATDHAERETDRALLN
jgi:hypothetical protein